jgi:guanine deaminase
MLTLGNARALGLEDRIGTLAPGSDADVVVLDARATPAMAHRMETVAGDLADELADELFVLMTLGDDRAVRAAYLAGVLADGGGT